MMTLRHRRDGFTLIETMLYVAIVSMMSGTLTAVYIAAQEARVQQEYAREVEQDGTFLLDAMSRYAHRAEAIIYPAVGKSASGVGLQMPTSTNTPTIIIATATGRVLVVEKTTNYDFLGKHTSATGMVVTNIGGSTFHVAFDLRATIPTIQRKVISKHFESTITLYPSDLPTGGGCGTCPAPECTNHVLSWFVCQTGTCTPSSVTVPC